MIVATGLTFPEGPDVDRDGRLYCCNLMGGYIARIRPDGTPERVIESPRPNGLAIHPDDGTFWIADSGARAILRATPGGGLSVMASGPFLGPNDLVFGPDRALYFTDPSGSSAEEPIGAVYRLEPSGRVELVQGELAFPNGLALTGDGMSLIVAETHRHRLVRIDLRAGVAEPFCDVGRGPDGMAMAADGTLYIALYREGCIGVVDRTGVVVRKLPVLDEHPTNCVIHNGSLYVTLAGTGRIQRLGVEV